jgi:hypothetical protein
LLITCHLLLLLLPLLQAAEDLYYKSGQLVKLLRQWAGTAGSLPGRFEELVIEMYERGYLGLQVRMHTKAVGQLKAPASLLQ